MVKAIDKLIGLHKKQPNETLYKEAIGFAKSCKNMASLLPDMQGREFSLVCVGIINSMNSLCMSSLEKGPTLETIEEVISGFLSHYVAIKSLVENDDGYIWSLQDEDLVNQWLMAIYFQCSEAEILYRNKVKDFLLDPPKNSQWEDQGAYDPIYFSYIKNMLASAESNQLSLVEKGSDYSDFFSSETIPPDPVDVLTDIHVRRASKGKGLKDPLEYSPWTVFPIEVLAWYRVACVGGVNVELGSSYSSKFIEIPFELKITHPDYLGLLDDVSELIGFDVADKYLN